MKDKFIRIVSPITLCVIFALDAGVLIYGAYAIKRLLHFPNTPVILFAALDVAALILAIIVTKEVFSNGIRFYDDELEFTGLDENNIFSYDSIEKIEISKDDSISFTKTFIDRQSQIILTLNDDKVITIELGITTKNTLKKAATEIADRTGVELEEIKPEKKSKEEE